MRLCGAERYTISLCGAKRYMYAPVWCQEVHVCACVVPRGTCMRLCGAKRYMYALCMYVDHAWPNTVQVSLQYAETKEFIRLEYNNSWKNIID